jgi:maltose alpha-D-glucosyltransferase/alpha-amylase
VHAAGDHGMRVIIDLVVNHTSDQHPWFVAARSSWDDTARAWYYHRFYAFQPDLNWSNPHVRAEITRVMGSGSSWGVGDSGWTRHRSSSS